MIIASLGWGSQSFGLVAMSALGVLPKVDAAVHADTGHERAETYAFAEKWTPWLEERGVQVVTVRTQDGSNQVMWDDTGQTMIPLFTLGPNGKRGILRRSCTDRWKISEVKRWIRTQIQKGDVVSTWLGISWDEAHRMSSADVSYQRLVYPFIEMFDRPMTRTDAMHWLTENNLEIPVKSACVFCPFHDRAIWREIQLSGNGDWEKALEVDRAIRNKRPGYLCFLTSERKPLKECDFRSQEEHGQLALWNTDDGSMLIADNI